MKRLYLLMMFLASAISSNYYAQCTGITAPFNESFSTGVLPNCWVNQNPTTSGTDADLFWKFDGSPDYGATVAINGRAAGTFAWVDASTPNTGVHDVELITPMISLVGLTVPYVQFDWFKNHTYTTYDDNKLTVSVNDGTGWIEIFSSTTNANTWRTVGVALNASYVNKVIQVRFSVDKDVAGNGYFYDEVLLDEVKVAEAPSCLAPSAPVVGAITTTTAAISWTAPTTPPANGYEVYYSTSDVPPTSTTVLDATNSIPSTGTSTTLTGLASSSDYYFWVRGVCAGTDRSFFVSGGKFATNCAIFNVPYNENFDSTSTGTSTNNNAPNCWSYLETSGSAGYGYVSSSTNSNSSPNSFYIYNSSDITGDNMLVSPETANLTSGTNRVRFFAKGTVAGYPLEIGTLSNPLDPTTFTIIGTPIILTTTQTEYIVEIPVGTNSYLAFRHGMNSSFDAIYIDDINVEAIPTCIKPSDVTINSITTSTAAVNWTAPTSVPGNGYQVYFSTTNAAPTASTILDATNSVTSSTTSATISGLTPATTYYVFVRAVCSAADQSYWTNTVNFITACTSFSVPYFENFDTTATGNSTNNIAPTCWAYLETSGSAGYGYVTSSTNSNSAPNSFYMNNSSDVTGSIMLVSPPTTNLTSGTNRVRFFAKGTVAGYPLEIGTLSNQTDPTTFTIIGSPIILTTTQTEYTVDIPVGTSSYLAFRHGMNSTSDVIYIDDVNVEAIPTCIKPSDVTVNSITTTTAAVNWIAPNPIPGNGYQVYFSTTNAAPTASTVLDATNSVTSPSTSVTITGLTPATIYYVFVRAICSSTDQSVWTNSSSTTTFVTACASFAVPYTENFDTTATGTSTNNNAPTCWSYLETSQSAGYGYVRAFNPNSTPNSYYLYNAGDLNGNIMLVSPPTTNLGAGDKRVRFQARGSAGYTLEVGILTDPSDPSTFFAIPGTGTITLTAAYAEYIVDLPAAPYSNVVFRHGLGGTFRGIYLDDMTVENIPACVKPDNVTVNSITSSTAAVNYIAPTPVPNNGYEVYYSTTNAAPTASTVLDATNSVTSATTSAAISGLTPATTYYVFVRALCSTTSKSIWTNSVNFITACLSFAVPYTENFDTTPIGSSTNNTAPNCWAYLETSGSAGYGYVRAFNPNSTPNSFYMYNSNDITGNIMLVSPPTTDIALGDKRVRFQARASLGYTIEVGYLTDAADPSTFIAIPTTGIVSLTAAYEEYTVDLPAGTYSNVAFRHGLGGSFRSIYLDDITVENIPTCVKPSNVTVNAITTTSGTVNWTAPTTVPGIGYEVYYSTTNTAPTATTVLDATNSVTSTTTSAIISGLSPATTYYVFVRAVCSTTDSSVWMNSMNFVTACASFSAPFSETFSTGTLPNCWSTFSTGSGTTTIWKFTGNAGYGASNSGLTSGTFAWVDASVPNTGIHDVTLQTPPIDLTGLASPMVQFSWFKNHLNGTGSTATLPAADNNQLTVMVRDITTSTWFTLFSNSTNDAALRTEMINLPASYVGTTVELRFIVDKDVAGNGDFYDDIILNDVEIKQSTLATSETNIKGNNVILYPNPFTDFIRISDVKDVVSISIVDLSGRLVKTMKPASELNLGDLKTGMYLINLKLKDGTVKTMKAIKK